jgi:hypothetical protein
VAEGLTLCKFHLQIFVDFCLFQQTFFVSISWAKKKLKLDRQSLLKLFAAALAPGEIFTRILFTLLKSGKEKKKSAECKTFNILQYYLPILKTLHQSNPIELPSIYSY